MNLLHAPCGDVGESDTAFPHYPDPRGGEYLWIGGTRVTMESAPDADTGAVHEGFVSVTPVKPDLMAREAMAALARYDTMEMPPAFAAAGRDER